MRIILGVADALNRLHGWAASRRNLILSLAGICLLSSLPLFAYGDIVGHDYGYHVMRIEGLAKELWNGVFPVRISSAFFKGRGYPSSIYYNDIFLYPAALLRMAGLSMSYAYKCYVLMINAVTAWVSYLCFLGIFRSRKVALLTALAYTTASYRLVDIYVRSAVGEYTALTFLPVVALAVHRIYGELATARAQREATALLAVGMSGLIGSHILSVEMAVLTLLVVVLALWRRTFAPRRLLVLFTAAAITLLLNLYFIVPFLDYYMNVSVRINATMNRVPKIQAVGARFPELFAFFNEPFGYGHMGAGGKRLMLTTGLVLMAACVGAVVLWVNDRLRRRGRIKFLTVLSVLMLWMASSAFPWNFLAAHSRLGALLAQVQFPWRYLGIAEIFQVLLLGELLLMAGRYPRVRSRAAELYGWTAALCVIMTIFFMTTLVNGSHLNYSYKVNSYAVGGAEYLRKGTDFKTLRRRFYSRNAKYLKVIAQNGTQIDVRCGVGDEPAYLEAPLLNYKGYHVTDDDGNEYEIFDGENNLIAFHLPPNFQGVLHIRFVEPWYWRLSEVVSLLTFIIICVWAWRSLRPRLGLSSSDGV